MEYKNSKLRFKRLGINTQHEHVVYMREDCHVCTSEGFEALTRIRITSDDGNSIVANLNIIQSDLLKPGEVSLSESAIKSLKISEGEVIRVSHLHAIESLSYLRSKIYGNALSSDEMKDIVNDIVSGNYSNVHLSAFITACAGKRLSTQEIMYLTNAMISSGQRFEWERDVIVDKHCIGGLPGNRTTPIIVSIITAYGLTMPKTSSRAITSPAGTADTMEVMTDVNLTMDEIRQVVKKEGGCIVWGGTAELSPADDILIKIEKALDIDSEGQLIASVLSKKVAAGSTHVVIDMPVGPTAKLRTNEAAFELKTQMEKVAAAINLKLKVIISDGTQPVGRGVGPALEARDILMVLRNDENAPSDLKERAILLAGELLELSGALPNGRGAVAARDILESGEAYDKFVAICKAQGGFHEPEFAEYRYEIIAEQKGIVTDVDNRKIAKLAKLAGAPNSKSSGVDFFVKLGATIEIGQVLYVIHAETEGELNYAIEYYESQSSIITITNDKR